MGFSEIMSIVGYSIEAFGVIVIIIGSVISSLTFLMTFNKLPENTAYHTFRRQLGRSILLGLEFLIAGDIIRTVIVDNSLQNVSLLALIILMRTFLSATLYLEVEGRWPWQKEEKN
ncbi:MAG: hypothetical protein QG567_497 [Campylobacterota bacterium]|nr:hypothetical protein [Campylobacterota bacterium]